MQKAIRIVLAIISIVLLLLFFKMQETRSQVKVETDYLLTLPKTMVLKSDAFGDGGEIPIEYTGKGANVSPQLSWDSVPEATKSFAITVTDYDAPAPFLKLIIVSHWALYDISHKARSIKKGINKAELDSLYITVAKNTMGNNEYMGPRPPFGVHEYYFRIYALDFNSLFLKNANRDELLQAIKGHILAYGELKGKF